MSELFEYKDVKNHPSKNGFDLSHKHSFTAKAGELLPVTWFYTNPGEKFKLQVQHMTRTQPVQTAAFARIKEYFDWYFVPMRLMWKLFPQFITMIESEQTSQTAKSVTESLCSSEYIPYLLPSNFLNNISSSSVLVPIQMLNAYLGGDFDSDFYEAIVPNYFGFDRITLFYKLASMLGYFNGSYYNPQSVDDRLFLIDYSSSSKVFSSVLNVPLSPFPFAAYQKIYQDHFRNEHWENTQPYNCNFDYSIGGQLVLPDTNNGFSDYWSNVTMFDLQYANYEKDLFFGLLPDSQYGEVAAIGSDVNSSVSLEVEGLNGLSQGYGDLQVYDSQIGWQIVMSAGNDDNGIKSWFGLKQPGEEAAVGTESNPNIRVLPGNLSWSSTPKVTIPASAMSQQFNILQLRQKQFLQKWKEIAASGGTDYKTQISKMYGYELPDVLSGKCVWLGGDTTYIDINEVVNQALYEGNEAVVQGKGVGVGSSDAIDFESTEHGIIMCIYHATPVLDYGISGFHPQLTMVENADFYQPVFDKLGFQELPLYDLITAPITIGGATNNNVLTLGYTTRNYSYKTMVDRVSGAFNTSLSDWIAPVTDDYIKDNLADSQKITYNFFKVSPKLLDPIFGFAADSFTDSDQFLINAQLNIHAVRPMDYNGLPY